MKKIVILFNLNKHQYEYEAEFDSEYTINEIFNVLNQKYEVYKLEADREFKWIDKLLSINPDLVFNICEGYNGPARESVYAALLEQLNFNYSGPDSTNLLICHNKYLVKNMLKDFVLVPEGYAIKSNDDIKKLRNIKYPFIVKLNSEGSSMGMTKDSIVNDFESMQREVYKLLNKYNRNILVEKYIKGQDISMIYVEGIGVMGPCIVKCDSEFYDYEMKTVKDNTVDIEMLKGDYSKLKNIVYTIVKRLDIKGYAKLDFRFYKDNYYLIEVNSQVSFHPEGEFIVCANNGGFTFEQIINHIVDYALKDAHKKNSIGLGDMYE